MTQVSSPLTVRSLVCHHHVDMALACLGSLLKFSADPVHLVIHDDGSLVGEDINRLQEGLKGASIVTRSEADELANEYLKKHPACLQYRHEQVYGLKLLDIPLLSEEDILCCDSDILFFRPFKKMFCWPNSSTSAIFMQDRSEAYSIHPKVLKNKILKLPSKVNVGLIFMRKQVYDLDFIEWLLGKEEMRYIPSWIEQTCWAALGSRVDCRLWKPKQVLLMRSNVKLNQDLVAGHFTSLVRNLLDDFIQESNAIDPSAFPVSVETISVEDCTTYGLVYSQLKRQIRLAKQKALYQIRSSMIGHYKRMIFNSLFSSKQ